MWSFIAAKRAINTGVVVKGTTVIVSHGDENLDSSELGMIGAIDGGQTGDIKQTKWAVKGLQFGFSSPLIDGDRVYQIETAPSCRRSTSRPARSCGGRTSGPFRRRRRCWRTARSTSAPRAASSSSCVRRPTRAEVLSEVELPLSTNSVQQAEGTPEPILAGAAISRGRVFFVSSDAVYAFGPKAAKRLSGLAADEPDGQRRRGAGVPAGLADRARAEAGPDGQAARAAVRRKGRFLREDDKATWSLDGLKGTVTDGTFVVASESEDQAGLIKATSGALHGEARARVARPLPWTENFEAYADGAVPPGWVNAVTGKFSVTTLDGGKVLQKAPDETIFQRLRMFIGPVDWSNYTFEADVRVATRRRQMGDIGITAQRYSLVLYGNSAAVEARTVGAGDRADGHRAVQLEARRVVPPQAAGGKPARRQGARAGQGVADREPEPAAWMIDKIDPIGNRQGAPGVFAAAQFGAYWTTSEDRGESIAENGPLF